MTHVDTLGTIVTIDGTQIKGIDKDVIPIPDGDTDDKDVSTLDDGYFQALGLGMFKPGSCEVSGNMISGDAGQTALKDAFGDRQLHTIQVNVVEAGEIYEYQAYVTKFNPGSDGDTYKFSAKFLASGPFTRTTTKAGITSIEGAAVGITYYPSTANSALAATADDVIFTETTGITTDTVEVTAAAASSIAISYNNGTSWSTLTSGTAATFLTTKWPAAGALSKALIRVMEANKATRFVNLFVARA